jgi:hypothetical protein
LASRLHGRRFMFLNDIIKSFVCACPWPPAYTGVVSCSSTTSSSRRLRVPLASCLHGASFPDPQRQHLVGGGPRPPAVMECPRRFLRLNDIIKSATVRALGLLPTRGAGMGFELDAFRAVAFVTSLPQMDHAPPQLDRATTSGQAKRAAPPSVLLGDSLWAGLPRAGRGMPT